MQTVSNTTLLAAANAADETQHDFDFPQREAAFFYGLFLRGHSAEELRRDIEVPPAVLRKWHRESEHDACHRAHRFAWCHGRARTSRRGLRRRRR